MDCLQDLGAEATGLGEEEGVELPSEEVVDRSEVVIAEGILDSNRAREEHSRLKKFYHHKQMKQFKVNPITM